MRTFSGQRLRAARRSSGLTARALAGCVGRTERMILHYESGKARPPADVLVQLADGLGVALDDLFVAVASG